jgi:formylglycine-generating enzyme required for sulfatase activity
MKLAAHARVRTTVRLLLAVLCLTLWTHPGAGTAQTNPCAPCPNNTARGCEQRLAELNDGVGNHGEIATMRRSLEACRAHEREARERADRERAAREARDAEAQRTRAEEDERQRRDRRQARQQREASEQAERERQQRERAERERSERELRERIEREVRAELAREAQQASAPHASTPAAPPSDMVRIEPGRFRMGSPSNEEGRGNNEGQVDVEITRAFLLGRYEVTQGEWQSRMGNNPSHFSSCGDRCPVERVNWWDAVAYANARSASEGLQACYTLSGCNGSAGDGRYSCSGVTFVGLSCTGYRLPTEAEWEYAARAGTIGATYAGSMRIVGERNAPILESIAVYGGNSGVGYQGRWGCRDWPERARSASGCGPSTVGERAANPWGLHDMLGNVLEWTNDEYRSVLSGGRDPLGPSTNSGRVLRGGSWFNFARSARAASRNLESPNTRSSSYGFRLARSAH